jgi:hypothetical protein
VGVQSFDKLGRVAVEQATAGDIAAARSAVLGPASGSESLLVALIDQEAALDDDGMDAASAIALAHRGSADLVAVELDELLATGGRR